MRKNSLHFAVIVSGIDEEYQNSIIDGIHSFAETHCIDLSHFIAYGGILGNHKHDVGEFNIFRLANLRQFDGVILLTNTISSKETVDEILERVREAKIPAVSIDRDFDDLYSIVINNRIAMEEVVRHFVHHHGLRHINYISGPTGNPESDARLEAYRSVLEESGIPVEEERIYHGTFRGKDGRDAVETFLSSALPLPEAIICANDTMAISALITLDHRGIRVPEDMMVSGFDNTYNARNYAPELTSVERPLFQSGNLACSLLFDHLENYPKDRRHTLEMTPRYTESCGCSSRYGDCIAEFKKHNYQILESNNVDISLINRMSCSLVECDSFDDYIDSLKPFILETGCIEFYLCLCSDWQSRFSSTKLNGGTEQSEEYTVRGYTTEMLVPLCYYEGNFHYHLSCTSKCMLPDVCQCADHTRSLYFVPLHFQERCLGYFIIGNSDFPLRSLLFHSWSMNISNSLENIRKIICLDAVVQELDHLYAVDALTSIYNRNGFKRQTEQIFQDCVDQQRSIMVMFIDMDGLKSINDTYGHKAGDVAIRCAATILRECCMDDEICCRFGGDEFIIFGADYSEKDARSMLGRIEAKMTQFNETTNRPFTLNVSAGYHLTVPARDADLFHLITVADKQMYEEKRKKNQSKYLKTNLANEPAPDVT